MVTFSALALRENRIAAAEFAQLGFNSGLEPGNDDHT